MKEERLSDRDQFDLLLTFIIWMALIPTWDLFETGIFTIPGFIFLVQVGVILHGTWQSFGIHSQGDAQNFLARYICLLTPIEIRVWAVTDAIYFLLRLLLQAFSHFWEYSGLDFLSYLVYFLLEYGLFLAAQIYIFAQLRSLIRFVSTPSEPN